MRGTRTRHHWRTTLFCTASMLAGALATPALAQEEPGTPPSDTADPTGTITGEVAPPSDEEAIVITGFRGSLQNQANAKRNSINFTDSVFAEDIGQFPDTNIAESFNRIPGITINREITGEGLQVAIRGLGTNFTRVLLNGAPVAIASTGGTDAQSTNREVDLDLFPTELFTQLTVQKSPTAGLLEGGAAGTVNMRSARPFDNAGTHVNFGIQGTKNSNADKWGQRGHLVASTTMGDFGILVGGAFVRNHTRVTGFETIGWTNPNITAAQCGAGNTCNSTGGGNWTIPGTVPSNAGIPGVAAGTPIDRDLLLELNPGLTLEQIDNALIPRLGRPADSFGLRKRYNAIAALEWRPSDAIHFYVDSMWGRKKNNLQRIDMNLVGRNGAIIPANLQVDNEDCSDGCVVTSGTFYNSEFFLEYRPHIETTKFWGVNPGLELQLADNLSLDVQANYTKSNFHREVPSVLVSTGSNTGLTVDYVNDGGIPQFNTTVDLNNPASFGWPGARVNIQDEYRRTETKGVRGNVQFGDDRLNLRAGAAYDDVERRIRAFDNSQAWQNAVCGNNPSVTLPSPNTQPPCQGLDAPGNVPPAGYPTYPAYGTGFTEGMPPITWGGSLIPNSALSQYLMPGPSGFITVDWDAFTAASNYRDFQQNAPEAGGSNTGANGGLIREKTLGFYGEVNGVLELGGNDMRFNVGLRWVDTKQTIGGRVSLPDPRNSQDPDGAGPLPAACPGDAAEGRPRDGSCYPNVNNFVEIDNDYDNWLPSGNLAYNIGDNAVVRLALSKTMTRPNPNAMLPGVSFTSPSADVATIGNSALEPYISKNIDLGFEYYTGREGYISAAAFRKKLTGFTTNGTTVVPFSELAQYGITYNTLTPTQQTAIDSRGGPNSATVVVQQQVNATGTLTVNGLEFGIVQPLDFLLEGIGLPGFGFTGNLTIIDQKGTGAAPAIALGVAEYTYNATAYYERGGISARLSTTFNKGSQTSGANQSGIPDAALFTDDYQQWDFAGRLNMGELFNAPADLELTLDVINIFKRKLRSYFQFENATFTQYQPGRTVLIGVRGRF